RVTIRGAEQSADGIVVNTFEELEAEYVKEYTRTKGDKVWLRSINQPFIWLIRGGERSPLLNKWIQEEGFEERTKERGFIIRGWAPQVLLLSHRAIGGFLTHCGWNSTLEGVSAGVPLVTYPLFAEQFYNKKLAAQVLGIGVSVGIEATVTWGLEDNSGLVIKREKVKEAIEKLMDRGKQGEKRRKRARQLGEIANRAIGVGKQGEKRRKRARQLGEIANRAIGVGGSSHRNIEMLIEFVIQQTRG
ncbi:hypothetical protein CICLE_v10010868mg, partial [Citrus x clementina]